MKTKIYFCNEVVASLKIHVKRSDKGLSPMAVCVFDSGATILQFVFKISSGYV